MSAEDELPRWEHSGVPFRYRVRLRYSQRIPKRTSGRGEVEKFANTYVDHLMHMSGPVHSEPYGHDAAQAMVRTLLAPYLALGWRIESLVVNAYDEKDA